MALNSSSSLEPFRSDVVRSSINASLVLILIWTLWVALFSTLTFPLRLSLNGISIVLLIGAFWWTIPQGAFYLLLTSWIFSSFSLTPSGFFWVSSFGLFLILRFASYRFTLSSWLHILIMVFLISLLFDFSQAVMLGQVLSTKVISWKVFGHILNSAFWQAILASAMYRSILNLVAAR